MGYVYGSGANILPLIIAPLTHFWVSLLNASGHLVRHSRPEVEGLYSMLMAQLHKAYVKSS